MNDKIDLAALHAHLLAKVEATAYQDSDFNWYADAPSALAWGSALGGIAQALSAVHEEMDRQAPALAAQSDAIRECRRDTETLLGMTSTDRSTP